MSFPEGEQVDASSDAHDTLALQVYVVTLTEHLRVLFGQTSQILISATSPPRLITLVLLTGLSVLSLNMFLPSLSNIADEFKADYALVNLSIAGYLGVTAVLQLIMGPLSDRLGRRPVLLAGLVIFIISSLGCMLATGIWLAPSQFEAAFISDAQSPEDLAQALEMTEWSFKKIKK